MTPALGLLLTTCALLAAPPADNDPSAQAEAILQRVVKLPPEHQQIWLRVLEQRCRWAALITMKPDDARRERDRVARILHQKAVAWNDLVALLRQLDQREKAAVSHMVRVYRTEVYENFGQRRKELIDRQEAWFRIWSAWEKAGSPPEQQDRLMDWLADAIKASSKGTLGPLPADPRFGPDVELVSSALVKRLREKPEAQPEIPLRGPLLLRIPDPQWSVGRMRLPVAVSRRGDIAVPQLVLTVTAQPPQLRTWPAGAADSLDLTSLPPPRYAVAIILDFRASGRIENSLAAIAANEGRTAKPQSLSGIRPPAELPPPRVVAAPTDPPVAVPAPAIVLPAVSPGEKTAAVPTSLPDATPHRDVVAMLPHRLLQPNAAESAGPARYEVQRKPLLRDAAAPEAAAQGNEHAQVNLEELRTRIEGINLSLRNLEGEINEKRDFTVDQLDSLLSRLDILVLRQRDLTLFRDLITPQEQAKIGQIDSSRSAVATIGTHIAELRTRIRQNETLPETERKAALKQLDDLSDRLATLTAGK